MYLHNSLQRSKLSQGNFLFERCSRPQALLGFGSQAAGVVVSVWLSLFFLTVAVFLSFFPLPLNPTLVAFLSSLHSVAFLETLVFHRRSPFCKHPILSFFFSIFILFYFYWVTDFLLLVRAKLGPSDGKNEKKSQNGPIRPNVFFV